jgi:hypothetical protein
MRSFYGVDRLDNAYFVSENFSESLIERDYLFNQENQTVTLASLQVDRKKVVKALASDKGMQINTSSSVSLMSLPSHQELALILFAPQLVSTNDFVFVLDDLHRSKFNLVAVTRLPTSALDLDFLFAEMCPRYFNVEALSEHVFGGSGAAASTSSSVVMAVVEREKGV